MSKYKAENVKISRVITTGTGRSSNSGKPQSGSHNTDKRPQVFLSHQPKSRGATGNSRNQFYGSLGLPILK